MVELEILASNYQYILQMFFPPQMSTFLISQ